MPKPSKQHIIDAIVKEIERGKERGNLLSTYVKKWQLSQRTFDRYWKSAQELVKERQEKASKAADAVYIQLKEKAAKEAVMSKQERLEYLTKIARGQLTTTIRGESGQPDTDQPIFIETMERIKAISEINKMEGDYAPTKVAQTDKEGNDVIPFTDSQVDKIIKALETETG